VVRDLVVLLGDGGDYMSDVVVLRNQPDCSARLLPTPTAWRVIE
jgi:hypothetical protein